MAEVFYISARLVQLEVGLPTEWMPRLRKDFSKSFFLSEGLHCGRGDRGGCSIISNELSYVRLVIEEKDESRLFDFLKEFAAEHGFEFSAPSL
ncbi:MAG: hypothetical protein Q8L36_03385 [bacterium]|nr:hypothetical protein [bacterium]